MTMQRATPLKRDPPLVVSPYSVKTYFPSHFQRNLHFLVSGGQARGSSAGSIFFPEILHTHIVDTDQ